MFQIPQLNQLQSDSIVCVKPQRKLRFNFVKCFGCLPPADEKHSERATKVFERLCRENKTFVADNTRNAS
jgi:hypothetical protein